MCRCRQAVGARFLPSDLPSAEGHPSDRCRIIPTRSSQPACPRCHSRRLLQRVCAIDIEHCPNRGGELKIIAAILERAAIEGILTHLGVSVDLDSPGDCPSLRTARAAAHTGARDDGASRRLSPGADPTRTETHGSLQSAWGGAGDAGQSMRPRPASGQTAHGCARSGCPAGLVRPSYTRPERALRGCAASRRERNLGRRKDK
jgi:hypothetical protein